MSAQPTVRKSIIEPLYEFLSTAAVALRWSDATRKLFTGIEDVIEIWERDTLDALAEKNIDSFRTGMNSFVHFVPKITFRVMDPISPHNSKVLQSQVAALL
jgi:hypothetical protein